MLTAAALLSLARTRGIFAVPTRAGERGPVLLGSICDVNNHRTHEDLRRLDASDDEIHLIAGDVPAAVESIRDRGLDRALIRGFLVGGGWVYSILIEAVAVTGEELTDEQIIEVRNRALAVGDTALVSTGHDAFPGSTRWVAVSDCGETRPVPEADRREARARIAASINHRRGVLVDADRSGR